MPPLVLAAAVEAPVIAETAVAAGAALWTWMSSTAGVATLGAIAAIAGEEAARRRAEQLLRDNTYSDVCLSCAIKCQALACGVPGSKYRGGAHWCTSLPKNDGLVSHHTPAQNAYKNLPPGGGYLPPDLGPAIQMDPADHYQTATNPTSGPNWVSAQAAQTALISSGNWMGATALDVADLQSPKFHHKYDAAIAQMAAYTACMKAAGAIK